MSPHDSPGNGVVSDQTRVALVWILASAVALAVALAASPTAFVAGHYIPVGNDSFYHARRILDLLADPSGLREFDPLVHYPQGSLLIWPWGYDYLMSLAVRVGLVLRPGAEPIAVLDHLPVLAFPVCLALVLVICRQLGLSLMATAVALFATALFPLNQSLYGVGNVDHHFAEQLFVLGSLAATMAWLAKPESTFRACLAGVVFGVAPCIHNGLFIIQFPLVAVLFWFWLRGRPLPRNTLTFSIALVIATLAAAAPSTALWRGEFQFYTLSWFHVYFAACVAATCAYVSRVPFSVKATAILAAGVVAALVPVVSQLLLADRFLSVSVQGAERIGEVQSVWGFAQSRNSIRDVANYYSWLILLLPATIALCAFQAWRETDLRRCVFWVACLGGTILLALMIRLHVFGSFALYLAWVALIDSMMRNARWNPALTRGALALVAVGACAAAVPGLFVAKITANDPYYALTHDVYPLLADECRQQPGVALSNLDDANYIRYHTDCPVIANNFLLTAFHESKVREVRSLMQTPASELTERAPHIRYVFVHRQSLFRLKPTGGMEFLPAGDPDNPDPQLVGELIDAAPGELPPRFRLIKELSFEQPSHVVFARLFAIDPAPGT